MPNSEFLANAPTKNPFVAGYDAGPDPVDLRRQSARAGAESAMIIGDGIGLPIRKRRVPKVTTLRFNYPEGTIERMDASGKYQQIDTMSGYTPPAPEPEVTPNFRRKFSGPDLIITFPEDPVDKPGKLG